MSRAARSLGAAVVILAAVLAPAAGARTKPVSAEPLSAVFDEAHFLTRYEFKVSSRVKIRRITFEWGLQPPTEDPECVHFAIQRPRREGKSRIGRASWLHGDHHGCHHEIQDADGHPGFVTVNARIVTRTRGTWLCSTMMRGTNTAVSTYVPTCQKEAA